MDFRVTERNYGSTTGSKKIKGVALQPKKHTDREADIYRPLALSNDLLSVNSVISLFFNIYFVVINSRQSMFDVIYILRSIRLCSINPKLYAVSLMSCSKVPIHFHDNEKFTVTV